MDEVEQARRPVIATAIGGLVDAVEDGKTGRLVAPGSPDAMAQALEDVLGDPAAAEAMAMRGQAVQLSERSWSSVARLMLARFRALQGAPR